MALVRTCISFYRYLLTPVNIVRTTHNSVSRFLLPCILQYSSQYILQTFLLSDLSFPSIWRYDQQSRLKTLH